jgi:hypothetical protein
LGRWHVKDPNIEDNHHNYSPYAYVYNNPIKLVDPFGLDSTQRAQAVELAHEYVTKNPGNSYASGRGAPGENTDCSGLVSSCIINGEEPDPYTGKDGNGVSRIAQSSEKVNLNDGEAGNAITLDNSTSGKDKPMGHIGIIVEVRKNENGETTGFRIVDSGGRPSTGNSGPRYTDITIGGSGYWDNRVTGVYKWDTRPDIYNAGTLKQVTVRGQGSSYIKPMPITKVSVKSN